MVTWPHFIWKGAEPRTDLGIGTKEVRFAFLNGSGDARAGQDVGRKDKTKCAEFFQNIKISIRVSSFSSGNIAQQSGIPSLVPAGATEGFPMYSP